VRLVREADGLVVFDARRRRPGRGAWVCADAACVESGVRRERLAHAFRKPCRLAQGLEAAVLERVRARDAAAPAPVE
jgi:predicted RNA-binding protein YlxR (DUF448 family)